MDLNVTDNDGRTLLHEAIANIVNNEELVFFLLKSININSQDKWGRTILHDIFYNSIDKLHKKNEVIYTFETSLLKQLLDNNIDVNLIDKNGKTALYYVIENYSNDFELVNLLFQYKANPNISDINGDTIAHLVLKNFSL